MFFRYYKLDDKYFSHHSTDRYSMWAECLPSANNSPREIDDNYTSLY